MDASFVTSSPEQIYVCNDGMEDKTQQNLIYCSWTSMMFHFRPIFPLPDSQLQTTDMSNWPKVSALHLNHFFVYTSPLSLQLLQMQQHCGALCSNCKR